MVRIWGRDKRLEVPVGQNSDFITHIYIYIYAGKMCILTHQRQSPPNNKWGVVYITVDDEHRRQTLRFPGNASITSCNLRMFQHIGPESLYSQKPDVSHHCTIVRWTRATWLLNRTKHSRNIVCMCRPKMSVFVSSVNLLLESDSAETHRALCCEFIICDNVL